MLAGLALFGCSRPAEPAAGGGASLVVSVSGIASAKGSIMVAVCDRAGFLKQCAYNQVEPAKAEAGGKVQLNFAQLAPGAYAVMVYHDENGNRRFDTAANGIPLEGYGFSRNASGHRGPPSFDDAMITIRLGANQAAIELVY
ncbi:uncharacterized protein (DUF2141 family) [Oxalobacteraceae bacterium GrIS 1.11]